MPLEPTQNRARVWTDQPRTRRAFGGLLALGMANALGACTTGNRQEAERARSRDEERTSVVESMQQTATSSLVNSTPPATPTAEAD